MLCVKFLFLRRLARLTVILLVASLGIALEANATGLNPAQENLALGKPAVASSVENALLSADQANDGDPDTRWSSQFDDNEWIFIDLGTTYEVNRVVLNWEAAYGEVYNIDVSFDGISWETVFEEDNGNGGVDTIEFGTPIAARYVRLTGLERGTPFGFSLWEFEIYGGDPAIRYVDSTGTDTGNNCLDAANPCATIGHAIGQANSGNTIEIAAGAYTESLTIDKSLTLQGAGRDTTIIQAHAQPGMASSRVINVLAGLTVPISDMTIRHGKVSGGGAGGEGGGIFNSGSILVLTNVTLDANEARSGGGLYNKNNGTVALADVTFSGNSATAVGGGLRNFAGSDSILDGVTFVKNEADRGGGMGNNSGSHALTAVTFSGNVARLGGGLYNVNSSPELTDIIFDGNEADENGGGLYNNGSSPLIANVTFNANTAGNGGGVYNVNNSFAALVNVVFVGNEAIGGGGMVNLDSSSPALSNVTFSQNMANAVGGAMLNLDESAPTLANSLVWGNTAGADGNEIYNDVNASSELTYSLYKSDPGDIVEGGGFDADANSFSEDPLFVDAVNGDLQLQEGSPAINAGDPDTDLSLFPTDGQGNPVDRDGNPRVQEERIDIGAFEVGSALQELYLPLVTHR